MSDVRIPAGATLAAAIVAVVGSIAVVWLSGRQQRRLQSREFVDRIAARHAQWNVEATRSARAAELESCVQFDAAVSVALARLIRMTDLLGRPRLRRRLLGWRWAQQWNREVTDAALDFAVPLSAVKLKARPAIRKEVTAVATAFDEAASAVATLPTYLPEWLLRGPVVAPWRKRVEEAIAEVQGARGALAAVLDMTGPGGDLDD
ncbi:hypothetical protein [Blastococcus sp. LR1]|uniref:hypothetical protein n=1 Tax=Blastococcus sp. LR1 TaxID=2877000 RepID=UPI001CCDA316|nr:hypothetical protein [Blastococcus sp. LR1]MCA0144927.1 hypothetical protein [Blastococcus sp. LR1]